MFLTYSSISISHLQLDFWICTFEQHLANSSTLCSHQCYELQTHKGQNQYSVTNFKSGSYHHEWYNILTMLENADNQPPVAGSSCVDLNWLKTKGKSKANKVLFTLTYTDITYKPSTDTKKIPELLYCPMWWRRQPWSSNRGYLGFCQPHARKQTQTKCVHDLCAPCGISYSNRSTYAPDKTHLFWSQEKSEYPKLESHARIKMGQVLGSLVYTCEAITNW